MRWRHSCVRDPLGGSPACPQGAILAHEVRVGTLRIRWYLRCTGRASIISSVAQFALTMTSAWRGRPRS
eukprot:5044727-Pyramimonas_sp.AAC.1